MDSLCVFGEVAHRDEPFATIETVDGDVVLLRNPVGKLCGCLEKGVERAGLDDASREVEKQKHVMSHRYLWVEDGLFALKRGDELTVFVNLEGFGGQPCYGVAAGSLHREVERDVAGPLHAGVDEASE